MYHLIQVWGRQTLILTVRTCLLNDWRQAVWLDVKDL